MKTIIQILILALAMSILSSCDKKDNDEPLIIRLNINHIFKTETKTTKLSELEDFDKYQDMLIIVNSVDEIPLDHFFPVDEFNASSIDFSKESLILVYQLIPGDILDYKYSWHYNKWNEHYLFNSTFWVAKNSEYLDDEIENLTYVRSAISVSHIPGDSKWKISQGIHN